MQMAGPQARPFCFRALCGSIPVDAPIQYRSIALCGADSFLDSQFLHPVI
jgi:hypothetical protein